MSILGIFVFVAVSVLADDRLFVVVDPGHGGSDSGATKGKVREADVALSVAIELSKLLEKDSDFRVSLTRTKDEKVTLTQRSNHAKKLGADVFLSIHLNSNPDGKAKGAEFYFQNQLPPDEEVLFLANTENQVETDSLNEEKKDPSTSTVKTIIEDIKKSFHIYMSRELAKIFKQVWRDQHGRSDSHIRQGPFHVISQVPMPSLLVELGFISHSGDFNWLQKSETQSQLAKGLYSGLKSYKERLDKQSAGRHITSHAN